MTATIPGLRAELFPPGVFRLGRARPCQFCSKPAWLADASGGLHTCCEYWRDVIAAGDECPSCRAAKACRRRRFVRTVIDQRAIASGKRRSTEKQYREAQRAVAK